MSEMRIVAGTAMALGGVVALTQTASAAGEITLYSGRGETLVNPIIDVFEAETGITVNVRYGGTAELAVLIQEEGEASPADVYWAQDGGALGQLALDDMFAVLPGDIYDDLPDIYTSETGTWVATSGRARVLAYSPDRADEFPDTIFDLEDAHYGDRFGWAPTNGSFQAFVTAMRVTHGDDRTREWLEAVHANGAQQFENNTALVQAIANGEIDYTITNNYYLSRFLEDDADFPVSQRFFEPGDTGNLVNVAGAGILATSDNQDDALAFIEYLLSEPAQQFFTSDVYEYPVVGSVERNPDLEPFDVLLESAPEIDLDQLEDLDGTLDLLREVGLL